MSKNRPLGLGLFIEMWNAQNRKMPSSINFNGLAIGLSILLIYFNAHIGPMEASHSSDIKDNVLKEFVAARQVYVYRAFKDMQIFHFTIPPHLSHAVFNLTSNNTDGCDPRNITVYLQSESFPVISPDGAEFPESTWINRQPLYHATLLSDLVPVYLTILGPQPGDWFMVGFIFDNSNRITQAGLFPSCYAWLQVDASYHQENNIEILNTHVIVNETSFLQYDIKSLTYFSFFVPSQVWSVDVTIINIKGQNSVGHSMIFNGSDDSATLLSILLRPLALPFKSAPNVIEKNCTLREADVCSFKVTPKEDSWHYLAITPTSESVSFEIGVSIHVCGIEETQPKEDITYLLVDDSFNFKEIELEKKLKYIYSNLNITVNDTTIENDLEDILSTIEDTPVISNDQTVFKNILQEYPSANDAGSDDITSVVFPVGGHWVNQRIRREIGNRSHSKSINDLQDSFPTREIYSHSKDVGCWPRHQLMRKTFPGNFVFEYDLKPKINGSNPLMLNISNHLPTVLSYDLMPIIDIGGTLIVDIAVSPFMNTTSHNVSIIACLNFGIRSAFTGSEEGLKCERGQYLHVNTSQMVHFSGSVMVPYPEPGRWYFTLYPSCYLQNRSEIVSCTENETSVIFNIASSSCILGKCGKYGSCYQMISGGFIFSTCVCEVGYRGYACTDGSDAIPNWKLLLSTLLLCLSNLFFLPAICLAVYRRHLTEALIYTFTMMFSTFYHACDQDIYSFCLMRLSVLQFCDFYSAILSFWVTLIAMANLPPTLYSLLHMAGAVIVALGVEYDRTGLWVFAIPSISAFIVMVISWICHSKRNKACYPPRGYWIKCLIPGTVFAIVGLICYAFLETEDNYYIVHSIWHAIMALSILCLLPPRTKPKGSLFAMANSIEEAQGSDSQALTVNLNI